jgi:hypothetical protein
LNPSFASPLVEDFERSEKSGDRRRSARPIRVSAGEKIKKANGE